MERTHRTGPVGKVGLLVILNNYDAVGIGEVVGGGGCPKGDTLKVMCPGQVIGFGRWPRSVLSAGITCSPYYKGNRDRRNEC